MLTELNKQNGSWLKTPALWIYGVIVAMGMFVSTQQAMLVRSQIGTEKFQTRTYDAQVESLKVQTDLKLLYQKYQLEATKERAEIMRMLSQLCEDNSELERRIQALERRR